MTNKTNPGEQEPGAKQPGKYHYNPGNMSGKTAETAKDEAEPANHDNKKTDQPDK